MRAKISMMPVNMTGYPSIRKTAHHGPALAELEFARDRFVWVREQADERANCTPFGKDSR